MDAIRRAPAAEAGGGRAGALQGDQAALPVVAERRGSDAAAAGDLADGRAVDMAPNETTFETVASGFKGVAEMQTVIPDLHASAPVALSLRPRPVRPSCCRRRQGNLLIYSAGTVAHDARAIEDLGGIARHYLDHWHEAAFGGGERIASTFGAPLFCHEDDRQPAAKDGGHRRDVQRAP